ncbi:cupin domain-containing protein [Advenella kashmirensis]|uniref:cupin domain-containing protein n=1 Tax=Advenella kashmirensis TaxID=310575 RepID=UPI00155AB2EF
MAPKVSSGSNQSPGILGLPGLTVNVCRCPPGQGPNLHCHERTIETFMTLQGEFKCQWGDQGEYEITLGQFDMVSFLRNVMRRFENSDTQESLLLVLVQYGIQRLRMMPGLQKSSRHSVRTDVGLQSGGCQDCREQRHRHAKCFQHRVYLWPVKTDQSLCCGDVYEKCGLHQQFKCSGVFDRAAA